MKAILLLGAVAGLSACATLTRGTEDVVTFESDPPGATATIADTKGKYSAMNCVTPCELELNRKWTYLVTFALEGFEPAEAMLEPKVSGEGATGMAGNVLIGGLVGIGIDAATGAANDLKPNPLVVTLLPLGAAQQATDVAEELPADGEAPAPDTVTEETGA